jgi:hypothetical protein
MNIGVIHQPMRTIPLRIWQNKANGRTDNDFNDACSRGSAAAEPHDLQGNEPRRRQRWSARLFDGLARHFGRTKPFDEIAVISMSVSEAAASLGQCPARAMACGHFGRTT